MARESKRGYYLNIDIRCQEYPDTCITGHARDEVQIDCGDFSEDRLLAVLNDTNRKIRQMWNYLQARTSPNED